MRILITNDDGVTAPGIAALARAVATTGHEVIVVAPAEERSGSGAAVGVLGHGTTIHVDEHDLGIAGVRAFGVDGPPACCSLMAFFEVFGPKPDLVLAGVNPGANTGRGLLQSGTVGAVLTAADLGISGAAISQAYPGDGDYEQLFDSAAQIAVTVLDWLITLPRKTALNVNVPNVPIDQIAGFRWGRIAAFGPTSMTMVGSVPGPIQAVVKPRHVELKPDTDTALLTAGFVSITSLVTPRPTDPLDPSKLDEALRRV